MNPSVLREAATADLQGAASIAHIAEREGFWDPETYATCLSEKIRRTTIPLDKQKERLAALAGTSELADNATAEVLAQHLTVLEALHQRFALEAVEALAIVGSRGAEIAERFLNASVRAQAAAMKTLSAMKVLRDSGKATPTTLSPSPSLLSSETN